ncbi:hypothetical protein PPTG_02397 [Phytophthora nicotianae INRA-310]|uniref:Uncharacterized protein n=3 Tax=Phytophthora nicotianae TaxID=4792 RepID=W2RAM0_PHYN3|nr:hypothetical protein PPTG_02397 [Phytophthora nicotianae INRA-310]ETN22468.1 hypothetical protein PPTG_02397 [Phytophthora nicotianae INRA-310]KUF95217.1 hypothetical protein AM587_10009051 [Phytophthora nicotianae]
MPSDQTLDSTIHVADGNLRTKLDLTYPDSQANGCSKLRLKSCNVKPLLKRSGGLVAFHLLNAVVAVIGAIAAALTLAALALTFGWVGIALAVAVGAIPFLLLSLLPDRLLEGWLIALCYGALVVGYLGLYVWSWFNVYTMIAPYALAVAGGIGTLLFYLSFFMFLFLVKTEVRSANFVKLTVPFCVTTEDIPEHADPAKRIGLNKNAEMWFVPITMMTCRTWITVLYFATLKVVVGALSAATIFFAVIQPAISLFGGGGAPFFASSLTFHHDPIAYVGVIVSLLILAVVGMVLVATLSVKLTSGILGEWTVKQDQSQDERSEATIQDTASPKAGFAALNVASPTAATA